MDPKGGGRSRSVETQLRQRNIAGRLFGEVEPVEVGRFSILGRLGMGAMGAVYRAYDPTLDRAIALKVLNPDVLAFPEAESTLRLEAKALAQLSHPNVVAIHEVGGEAGEIWIAMELVDGGDLAGLLESLEVRSRYARVIDVMLQAGEGLSAAHEAGVVHRDFKPANVLLGTDGRVRVADFGLASRLDVRGETPATTGVGTPAYMAPEQWTGIPDARADQYAYCVALWECLFGVRPERGGSKLVAPEQADPRAGALVPVLRRGLQEEPDDRYPSMQELLEAIRDVVFERPRRRRRRRGALGVAAGLLGSAAVAAWISAGGGPDPCTGAQQRLEELWPSAAREQALAEFSERVPDYAAQAVPRIRSAAQAFGDAWESAYRTTCLAHARAEHSDYVFERRMSCLERAGAAYATLAERVGNEDADLPALVRAATGLQDPQACRSLETLASGSRPPAHQQADIDEVDTLRARARTYLDAGAPERALEVFGEAVALARAVDYGPTVARALHDRGRVLTILGPLPELSTEQALEDLDEASRLALLHRRYRLAVEAWSRQAWIRGTHGADPQPLLDTSAFMVSMVQGAAPSSAEEALLYNNIGGLHLAAQDREAARAFFERSVRVSASLRYPVRELDNAAVNLALVTDDNAARDRLFRDIVEEQAGLLGGEHPQVLQIELLFAVTTASAEDGARTLEDLVESYARFHPALVKPRFEAQYELAWAQLRERALQDAEASFEGAAALVDWDPLARDVARGYAALAAGRTQDARSMFEAVASGQHTAQWQRGSVASAMLGLAVVEDNVEGFAAAAPAFAELDHLPTAALVTRLEFATGAFASAQLDGLRLALRRWRSGSSDRAEIEAALVAFE